MQLNRSSHTCHSRLWSAVCREYSCRRSTGRATRNRTRPGRVLGRQFQAVEGELSAEVLSLCVCTMSYTGICHIMVVYTASETSDSAVVF